MKGDVDTDLFAIGTGEQDMAQASEEEGSPLHDDSIILEGPEMANLKVGKISDALDLVPVCKRELVEHTIAHAIGQGLDSLMECCKVFERADHRQGDGGHLIPPNLQGGWLAIYGGIPSQPHYQFSSRICTNPLNT